MYGLCMPSPHLLCATCDKWVYNFLYDFSGVVGSYGLQCLHHRDGSNDGSQNMFLWRNVANYP